MKLIGLTFRKYKLLALCLGCCCSQTMNAQQDMSDMWGEQSAKQTVMTQTKGHLFEWGNYAMFIHWGLYSNLANVWKGKTYYGIGEWIMSRDMANIDRKDYMECAKDFNPTHFNADEIARLAKEAGMKYIIITSKHHEGFAMYHSACNAFNIVDATPFKRDPMKELSQACKKYGLGFGFYYSHNQDWVYPGGAGGPKVDENGKPVTFDDYYKNKCLPQVEEITTQYGDIELVWFDTPGNIPYKYAKELVEVVNRNQPNALVSGRVGHGMGDYLSLGDMEVPFKKVTDAWEGVDVTNDSWGFAWYDTNWKSPKQILKNLVSTVARGGTYMLNVGLDGKGDIPSYASSTLRTSGKWIQRYPQVVYGATYSPWTHAMPWGDVVQQRNKLYLCVYEWPATGKLYLAGLKNAIKNAAVFIDGKKNQLQFSQTSEWTTFEVPYKRPESLISVIEVTLADEKIQVDDTFGVDPQIGIPELSVCFAKNAEKLVHKQSWMEKFGEWKHAHCVSDLHTGKTITWEIDIQTPQTFLLDVKARGEGQVVWKAATDEGVSIQNQQNISSLFTLRNLGWIYFSKPGKHTITLSQVQGPQHDLSAIALTPIELD